MAIYDEMKAAKEAAAKRTTADRKHSAGPELRRAEPAGGGIGGLSAGMAIDSNPTVARMAAEAAERQVRAIAVEIVSSLFPGLLREHLPQPLRDLANNVWANPPPADGVLTARMDARAAWWGTGGAGGAWSGRAMLFYGEEMAAIDVSDQDNILGSYFCCYTGIGTSQADRTAPGGTWAGNRWSWAKSVPSYPFVYWHVADEYKDANNKIKYRLNAHTCGDIRMPIPIPSAKFMVVQQLESGVGGDHVMSH